ncbi:iron-containing alcohol dehydrogenase [Moellerella wisconsensis]|uniref:iron-containing alcohol dehydrogenase n=1 Tax=Moellerella wisconsensis TaxID=158849 RepID=UPI0006412DDA|nr:iron-containing alcohol dehydrogenase [Moellerella wisconsensis]KLN96315.1 aldehyde reductase [Moellerella wisconsensis]UNH28421.1 iron-containing alcohol dehydrogenase [Moellerella wisconsensis]WJW82934.1 iron-containing alcohol dehydrogenase [Moellerella wisconsensis]
MLNFNFYNPTRIIFGAETIGQLNQLIPNDARVLLLFGGESARRNGTLDEIYRALGQRQVEEFGGIEPNPSYETLMRAVSQIRENQVDFLLAVGGGSVIDGTKFIAAAVEYDGEPWEILETRGSKITRALPFGSVLTLPATGSEMNSGAVITRKATQDKLSFMNPLVFPQFSILDPTKTYTLPTRQVANGIADAFVHVVEQYLTYPADAAVQDRFAEGLLQTLIEISTQIKDAPEDYAVRANLMWAASLALNGLIGAGVPQDWSTHIIGHELTAMYGIDHARTLAIVLPANLQIRREAKRQKLLQYAQRIWGITDGTEESRIDQAIEKTRQFFETLDIGTHLSDYDLSTDTIDAVIKQLEKHGMTAIGEHQDVDLATSRRILQAAL